jgi:hypothetical protein
MAKTEKCLNSSALFSLEMNDEERLEQWKQEADAALDELVASCFEEIYSAQYDQYYSLWAEICGTLYRKYHLEGEILPDHLDVAEREKKKQYIFMSVRIFSEKEFPYELLNERVLRFVRQYSSLPRRMPEEWQKFEVNAKLLEGNAAEQERAELHALAQELRKRHPEYHKE